MYKKILVPLDGSRLSEVILPYARAFAKAFEIPVELLHSIHPEDLGVLTDPRHGRNVSTVQEELTKRSRTYLEGLVPSFPTPSNVQPFVELGPPAEQIIDRGSEEGTLIAMSTRGLSGPKRWFLGSVADKVLHGTSNPLLLVRAAQEDEADRTVNLKRILVPLDGSALAEHVLPYATAIAKTMNLKMEFLRAYSLPVAVVAPTGYPPSAELVTGDNIRKEIEGYLKDRVERTAAEGINDASYIIPQGEAADQIIDTAQKTPGTLVAMSTHGRSGIGRWILGSVAARVTHHSGEPVLVIRPTTEQQ